jgi:hypothetical protein
MGTSYGVGASHLSFLLSSYFIKLRNKIAVVEWGKQDTFRWIEAAYEGKEMQSETSFQYKKADFYKNYQGTMSALKDMGYAVIIVDFGPYNSRIMETFNAMDLKILVGHGNEWKAVEIEQVLALFEPLVTKTWKLVLSFGTKEEAQILHRQIRKKAVLMSYYKDPFLWTKEMREEVESILGV